MSKLTSIIDQAAEENVSAEYEEAFKTGARWALAQAKEIAATVKIVHGDKPYYYSIDYFFLQVQKLLK